MSANNRMTNVIKNADFKSSKQKTQNARCIGSESIFADDTNTFRETLPKPKYGVSYRKLSWSYRR